MVIYIYIPQKTGEPHPQVDKFFFFKAAEAAARWFTTTPICRAPRVSSWAAGGCACRAAVSKAAGSFSRRNHRWRTSTQRRATGGFSGRVHFEYKTLQMNANDGIRMG